MRVSHVSPWKGLGVFFCCFFFFFFFFDELAACIPIFPLYFRRELNPAVNLRGSVRLNMLFFPPLTIFLDFRGQSSLSCWDHVYKSRFLLFITHSADMGPVYLLSVRDQMRCWEIAQWEWLCFCGFPLPAASVRWFKLLVEREKRKIHLVLISAASVFFFKDNL